MYKKSLFAISALAVLSSSSLATDTLEDIVVTSKSNKSINNLAGSVSIVTQEDIKRMNATSIQEVLEEVAGVNVGINDSSIGGRQTISIRGSDSKHSLILLDGRKVSGSDAQVGHSDFQYNWLPLSAIEKIEVVRGPMSAIYGSSAIGGVVNIITKKPEGKFGGELELKYGDSSANGGDERSASVTFGGEVTDKLSIAAFFEKKDVEITKNKDDETDDSDREGKEITNKMLSAWYDIDDTQQILASYIDGDEIREYFDSPTYYDNYYNIDRNHYSLVYKKSFGNILMDLEYYVTSSDSHTDKYEYTHEMDNTVVKADFSIASIDNNFIAFGIENSTDEYVKVYDDSTDDATKGFEDKIRNSSAYVQDEIDISDNLLLVLGLRYDNHEKFGSEFSPKMNMAYAINENHKIKVGYGQGYNAPTLTQNSDDYVAYAYHEFYGNDDLTPETSKTFEVGYEFKNKMSSLKTSIFKTEVKDLIDSVQFDSSGYKKLYRYENIDEVTLKGLELDFEHKFNETFDMRFVYNYLKTKDESTGEELQAKPKQKINLSLNSKLPLNVNSTLRVKYTGKQQSTDSNNDEYTQKAYTTVGMQFSKVFKENLTVRLGVENLTNKQLEEEAVTQLKGRVIYLGLNYNF